MSKPDDTEKTYLDEDPISYDDGPAERRASSHATLGGSRVWQDFGAKDVDRQIRLRTDWMTQTTLDAFKAKFAQAAKVWKWVDHRGHEYRVFFRALNPERIRGHDAYRAEMLLDMVQVVA
jgi:hypothetical protein